MRLVVTMLVLAIHARDAAACSPLHEPEHVLDPTFVDDIVPPSPPVVTAEARTTPAVGTCGARGYITLTVHATDDRAPADRIGYLIDMDARVVAADGGRVYRSFSADSPSFTRQFLVRAVDLNGNMSEPTLVDVVYEAPASDEGCSAGGSPGLALALLVLARCTLRRYARPSA